VGALQLELAGSWAAAAETHALPQLKRGHNQIRLRMTVDRAAVELWWPVGYGNQRLYTLTAALVAGSNATRAAALAGGFTAGGGSGGGGGSSMTRALGFRTVRLQTDSGEAAAGDGSSGSGNTSMILLVNGRRVLVLGSSLVPMETFNGRITASAARRLLRSTAAANMNALRVWGGGNYLPPQFYDMADEEGIMLLHDAMLSWYPGNPYPAFPAFRARLVAEVSQKVADISRHPAVVLW
jgi:beta-mannosidase